MTRRFASLLLVFALGALVWAYVARLPGWALAPQVAVPAPSSQGSYHDLDRALLPGEEGPQYCGICHLHQPHRQSPRDRAFLNAHALTLDCGVCHLTGGAIAVRRFRDGAAVTSETLAQGAGGKLYAASKGAEGWVPLLGPGPTVAMRSSGPECRECHRRGSPLLAADGLFDHYRRLVLEDIAAFRWWGAEGR